MPGFDSLGFSRPRVNLANPDRTEYVMIQRPLRQLLSFTRRSIDDVVNCPVAKREILGYYKLQKQIDRTCETVDLERWWSGQSTIPPRVRS